MYWHVATITKEEDARLPRDMPDDWDGKNVFARYEAVGIKLQNNSYYRDHDPPKIVEILEQIGGEQ
jgi:hypothetical protein